MNLFAPNTPGIFYDLPFEEYAKAPGISQSMLKAFAAEATPRHYQDSLTRPREATEAMEFGTVLHAAVLTPALLGRAYHLQPDKFIATGMKCPVCGSITDSAKCAKCKCERAPVSIEKPWDNRTTICDAWTKEHSDRPILTVAKAANIKPIVETVSSLPVVSDILRTGQKEVSFFKIDPETGLLLKCRLDAIATDIIGTTFILDLKKVRRGYARDDRFGYVCRDLGYYIQCASYLAITGATKFIFAAMEEDSPFDAHAHDLDEADIAEGYKDWREMLLSYAKCLAENKWPGYPRTVSRVKMPKDYSRPTEAEVIYS